MILKGEKIILRPMRVTDASLYVRWLNDPEVNKFLATRELTLKAEKEKLKKITKETPQQHFAIETKGGITIGGAELSVKNKRARRAELGLHIGDKNYWGQGLGKEVMNLLLQYGFKKLKLHRIELDVYEYNKRAIALYKKLGFKKEGVRREHNFYNGKFYSTYHMSILDREFEVR